MKAKELLASEADWCQGPMALDISGRMVGPSDESAVRFCLTGAVMRCYPSLSERQVAFDKLVGLIKAYGFDYCSSFNDNGNTTYGMVKAVLENADV